MINLIQTIAFFNQNISKFFVLESLFNKNRYCVYDEKLTYIGSDEPNIKIDSKLFFFSFIEMED